MATTYPVAGYPWLNTSRTQGVQLDRGQIDVQDVSPVLLRILNTIGSVIGKPITIFSGYRTSAYSAKVGGFAGDPHSQHRAVDAEINGTPITRYPGVAALLKRYGLVSGDQPNFYKGQPDPTHVQLPSSPQTTWTTAGASTAPPTTHAGWVTSLLRTLGAPVNTANVLFLEAWARFEGTAARFNPLATTQPWPGATPLTGNPDGVKNYPSATAGINATVQTLTNGRYPHIVEALRSGNPANYPDRGALVREIRTWGTTGFADAIQNAPSGNTGGGFLSGLGGAAEHIPGVEQAESVFHAGEAVGGVISAPADAIRWVFSNWDRVLEVLGGAVLVALGVYMLGKQMALPKMPQPSSGGGGGGGGGSDDGDYRSGYEHGRTHEAEIQASKAQRASDRATVRANRSSATRRSAAEASDIPY